MRDGCHSCLQDCMRDCPLLSSGKETGNEHAILHMPKFSGVTKMGALLCRGTVVVL